MPASTEQHDRGYTTLSVSRKLHSRLEQMKPYSSMSFGKFIHKLADTYENERH